MKKYLAVLLVLSTVLHAGSKVLPESLWWETMNYPSVHMLAPSKYYFTTYDDIYVKIVVSNQSHYISYIDLYLGKEFIGRETSSPYEWCKPNSTDHASLRKMAPGIYSLSAVVKYADGKKKVISRKFEVKSPWSSSNNFDWMKKIQAAHPDWKIDEYRQGSMILFKMQSCRSLSDVYWYDAKGLVLDHINKNSSRQGRFSSARFVKSRVDPCH